MSVGKIYPAPILKTAFEETPNPDVLDDRELRSNDKPIQKAFLPLTVTMRLFGMYFKTGDKVMKAERCFQLYSLLIVVVMILNAVRLLTIFTAEDLIQTTLLKLGFASWAIMCACVQLSCYRSCASGRLEEFFDRLTKECGSSGPKHFRLTIVVLFGVSLVITAFNCALAAYTFFAFEGYKQIEMTPVYTIFLDVDSTVVSAMRWVAFTMRCFGSAINAFPMCLNFALALVLGDEFRKCTKRFRDVAKQPSEVARTFEELRHQHQKLSRLVEKADDIVVLSNGAYFVSFIANIIICVFLMIWNKEQLASTFMLGSMLIQVALNLFWLTMLNYGTILVNSTAHKIYDKIHDIDLTNLTAETIGQISIFLNRLTGEPIGFTILKIFVIDRNTILTVLGLLITYFLLILQFVPTSSPNSDLKMPSIVHGVTTTAPHSMFPK